jgi:hypothetical protein
VACFQQGACGKHVGFCQFFQITVIFLVQNRFDFLRPNTEAALSDAQKKDYAIF